METHVFSGYLEAYDPVISIEAIFRILEKKNDIDIPERKEKDGPVFSQMDKYINTGDWGIAIFGKKHCWHNIPEDLKIICGDNYILKKQKQKNRINYEISNVPINHIHASSSGSPEFTKIIQSDIIHSARYFPNQTESRV